MKFIIEKKEAFKIMGLLGCEDKNTVREGDMTGVWAEFMANYDKKLRDYYSPPYGQIGAKSVELENGKSRVIVGAEYKEKMVKGMSIEEIPAATWAAFSYEYPAGFSLYEENYKRIVTEWLPTSGYKRDENVMHLELYDDEKWQLRIPIISK